MPPGTPCVCIAPILEEEFEQEELEPLMQFMRAFMAGLKGDEAAAQKTIDRIAAEHGQATIEDWLKRFEALSPETAKTCNFKF
jgi:predicted Zn-dependent peptidase